MIWRRFGAAVVLAALLLGAGAMGADRVMVLELILNGRSTGRVGEFVDRDGTLYAKPSELHDLGFALPPELAAGTEPIPFSSVPNVQGQVNEAKQILVVNADDAALLPNELSAAATTVHHLEPISPTGFGALLNYDFLATLSGQQQTEGALTDFRAFSPYGLLESTGLGNFTPLAGQRAFERLDTTYTYSDPDALRQWRAGDVITGALAWTRAARLGGGQVASDFALRPDLITYPLPVISSSAAVPSTVNVLVNGIRQFSETVQPGPFAVQSLPVVTGAGEVAVAVQDALGRQTLVTMPFYASTALLKPGLASYSLDAGVVRQNYGLMTDRYAGWGMNASGRYGLTDWLTLEGHAETAGALALLGTGVAVQIGTLGIANAAIAGSTGRGGLASNAGGGASGTLVSAGFQRMSHGFSLNLSATFSTDGYRDIAAVNGSPVPKSMLNASFGYDLGGWGSLGAGYVKQISRPLPPGPVSTRPADIDVLDGSPADIGVTTASITNPQVALATASYSVPVAGIATFYATGYKDIHMNHDFGFGVGLSFALDQATSASVGSSMDGGKYTHSASVAKSALEENDYGYRLQDSEGAAVQRLAQGEFLSQWGRMTVGLDQSPGQLTGQIGASGAVAWLGGKVFASPEVNDSFAVVHTGDVADVPVLYENRLIGVSDGSGELMVPSLLSYQNNVLSVDPTRLPPDIDIGQTSVVVRPPDRSGVVVQFHIRKVFAALLSLQDEDGHDLPLGSVVKVEGAADQPVGYDGEAYATGLKPENRVEVDLPNGTSCIVQFDYKPVPGDIPVIGPLRCR